MGGWMGKTHVTGRRHQTNRPLHSPPPVRPPTPHPTQPQTFHGTHYRPDNAHLYIVGDVDVTLAEDLIRKYFGHLEAGADTAASRQALSLKLQSRHFPPVTHDWSGGRFDQYAGAGLPASLKAMGRVEEGESRALRPRIFQHENIQVGWPGRVDLAAESSCLAVTDTKPNVPRVDRSLALTPPSQKPNANDCLCPPPPTRLSPSTSSPSGPSRPCRPWRTTAAP